MESQLVAASLGLNKRFQETRRRVPRRFHDEPRDSEHDHHNEEREFQINVFNVALDRVICEIARRFEKTKQVNDMFPFIWNSSEVSNTDGETAARRIEIRCKDLSKFYPNDLNENELLEEMRLLDRLKRSNSLGGKVGKLSSIALLNKICCKIRCCKIPTKFTSEQHIWKSKTFPCTCTTNWIYPPRTKSSFHKARDNRRSFFRYIFCSFCSGEIPFKCYTNMISCLTFLDWLSV
jgi:hypothetical protein